MNRIIFATGNKDKMREIREIMADMDVEIWSMREAGIQVDIVEDGTTFAENAIIKAKAVAEHTDAIDEEPFDSVISDTTRIVYGNCSKLGNTAFRARFAKRP